MNIGGASRDERYASVVPQVISYITEDTTLTVNQRFVRATPNGTADVTLTLPSVEATMGLIYDIESIANAGYDIILNDAVGTQVGDNLTTTDDYITVVSNGLGWRILVEVSTP